MTAVAAEWSGRRVTEARTMLANRTAWPTTCARCPRVLDRDDPWALGHIVPRWQRPDLTWEPTNWQVECRPCSDASGQAEALAKARAEGAREARGGSSSLDVTAAQPPPLPVSLPGDPEAPFEIPEELSWAHFVQSAPDWLLPWLELDENSNPPLAVSPLHPDAVGAYADVAVPWIEKVEGKTLRWWQRLGLVLKLQHDAEGRLLKRNVVETGPRRAGKSVGLRGLALWRMEHGLKLFGERQEIIHTGSDISVCRKAQKEAWRWAEAKWGPKSVTRGNGKEAIERPDDGSVWYVRAQDATYGWDTTLGLVDEGWDVKPDTVSEGLEPSLMGRQSPQLVQTSTSHRRARSTMRTALANALLNEDPKTLVLWWGARPGDDPADPAVWKAASPYWDDERHEFVASMYAKARDGQSDPELDDPDPMRGFACQFLNLWNLKERRRPKGEPVVEADDWAALATVRPDARPTAAAVESWFEHGVTLVLAWRTDDGTVVATATDHEDIPAAVAALRASGFRGQLTVGASLVEHPALRRRSLRSGEGQVPAAMQELQRLLAEGVVRHDGGTHLTGQVLALRTMPAASGPRQVSTERADAVKALVWAVRAARTPRGQIKAFVLPRK